MKIHGENTLHAPVPRAWEALLDPAVLVRTIPGCERLEATGENAYAMTVTAGVASIKGTYSGSCDLTDLQEHESLVMNLNGSGAPGTIGATVQVRFAGGDDETTTITYEADAIVGGMIGGVGQRMLTSVSRRMAAEFFGNVDRVLSGQEAEAPATLTGADAPPATSGAGGSGTGQVFTAPARATTSGSRQDFLTGVAVGAGLVTLGVVLGGIVRRP